MTITQWRRRRQLAEMARKDDTVARLETVRDAAIAAAMHDFRTGVLGAVAEYERAARRIAAGEFDADYVDDPPEAA